MRWLFRIVGVLLLVAILVVAGLLLLPGERIARIAADQVAAQTGRELVIEGGVKVSLWPVLGARTGPVRFANADWAGAEPMLEAESLSIGVAAADLLGGAIRVTEITADAPVLRLATRADGRANWTFGPTAQEPASQTEAAEAAAGPPLVLEALTITDARVIYSAEGAAPVDLQGVDLALRWADPTEPLHFEASARLTDEPLTATGSIADFTAFLDGAVSPVAAELRTAGGELAFDGRASLAGAVAGKVDLNTADTGRFLAALGAGRVDIPRGLGQAAKLSTKATYTPEGRLSLRDLALSLDGNALTGAADVNLADKPQFTVELAAGALDLTGLASAGAGGGSAPAGGGGWPTDPIDASALGLADGTLTLSAESIKTSELQFGATRAALSIDRSRAVLDLGGAAIFDGAVSGQLVANNRSGFSLGGNLKVAGIEMNRALGDLAGIDRLSGKADGNLQFLGSGGSVDAIMRSLSGKGKMQIGRGVISGIDLDQLMRSGSGSGGTTVFDSLAASFTITDGNLVNDDLLLLLSRFRAEGKGRVGLAARDIDYLFTPVALKVNEGKDLTIPVRIVGPWSGPSIRPDLGEALQSKIDVKTEELEQKAKEKVKSKLQEKLNVTVDEGQSAEDAIKGKLEDEAKKGLLKLLGQE